MNPSLIVSATLALTPALSPGRGRKILPSFCSRSLDLVKPANVNTARGSERGPLSLGERAGVRASDEPFHPLSPSTQPINPF